LIVDLDQRSEVLLLEYEESARRNRLAAKITAYRSYFEAGSWKVRFPSQPRVVFSVSTSADRQRYWKRPIDGFLATADTFGASLWTIKEQLWVVAEKDWRQGELARSMLDPGVRPLVAVCRDGDDRARVEFGHLLLDPLNLSQHG
jgi:hypothetical protein